MSLRVIRSPSKSGEDGMQTPVRNVNLSVSTMNLMDSLRKRATSTALRPRAVARVETICLDDTGLSEVVPPQSLTEPGNETVCLDDTLNQLQVSMPPPPRPSSIWLEEMISGIKNYKPVQTSNVLSDSEESNTSSLGILTNDEIQNTFGVDSTSDSDQSLMKLDSEKKHVLPSVQVPPEQSVHTNDENNTPACDTAAKSNWTFNNLNNTAANFPSMSPQPELGFDSKEFISADCSAAQQQLNQRGSGKDGKSEAIPSPQRIDLQEFSGFIGDGELELISDSPWLSPERRKACRVTIGNYFKMKSDNPKDVKEYFLARASVSNSLKQKTNTTEKSNSSTETDSSDESGDKTLTIDDTLEPINTDPTLTGLDVTLMPGQESIMSLTTIDRLLGTNKGSETLTSHFIEAAQQHTLRNSSNKTPAVISNASNSRETFVVSSPHDMRTPTTKFTPISASVNPSKPSVTSSNDKLNTTPNSSPRNKLQETPDQLSSKFCSKVKISSPRSSRIPVLKNRTDGSTVKKTHETRTTPIVCHIKQPLILEGNSRGVVGIPMQFSLSLENICSQQLSCCLVNVSNSKHINVLVPQSNMLIQPSTSQQAMCVVSAFVSGEYMLQLEVHVTASAEAFKYAVAPLRLSVEVPRISISQEAKDFVDFGLRPEDRRKIIIFTIENLGYCSIPLILVLEQDMDNPCFFFLIPNVNEREEVELSVCLKFTLPGSHQSAESVIQQIGVIFTAPFLDAFPNSGDFKIFEGRMKIILPGEIEKVLHTSLVHAKVGRSSLVVSKSDLEVCPGEVTSFLIKNDGVVPLEVNLEPKTLPDKYGNAMDEPALIVKPNVVRLSPGEQMQIEVSWAPPAPQTHTTEMREIHLTHVDAQNINIVSVTCRPCLKLEKLPIRTTRTQLSWGSVSSGLTSKQYISFRNCSNNTLILQMSIASEDSMEIPFKLLNDSEEVTRSLEKKAIANRQFKVTAMFCPLRPGPATAVLTISALEPAGQYQDRKLQMLGYGGHSNVVLRGLAIKQGLMWLTLTPGLGDFVAGNFTCTNTGTIPVFVSISCTLKDGMNCCSTIKPDAMLIPANGSQTVSVKLSEVSTTLSKCASGEVKSLASIRIFCMNEVSRVRLQKLIPHLSHSDRLIMLNSECYKAVLSVVNKQVEGQESMVFLSELAAMSDFSAQTALNLSRDLHIKEVELRAIGTGNNITNNLCEETVSPFVSFVNTFHVPGTKEALQTSYVETCGSQSAEVKEWSLSTDKIYLHSGNNFSSVIHVCNMSASTRLCLDVQVRSELRVTPVVTEVKPGETATLEVQLVKPSVHAASWKDAIKVYTANDVDSVHVNVIPLKTGHLPFMEQSNSRNVSQPFLNKSPLMKSWFTPDKKASARQPKLLQSARQSSLGAQESKVDVHTTCVNFPWTKVGTTTSVTLSIYNSTNCDKKVTLKHVSAPFSVEPDNFVVCSNWNKSVTVRFSPTSVNAFCEILEFWVECQAEHIRVQLQGHSVV